MIPLNDVIVGKKEICNALDVLSNNDLSGISKNYIMAFEDGISTYCNKDYGIATNSGTSALHLALLALDIKKGDEVIVPALTMGATVFAVLYTGATPKIVDVDKDTWNIDANLIEDSITDKTKAIIPVHLYGNPCEMDTIKHIAKKHNLRVIEDCAEALGAGFKDKPVGGLGDISCHSFYATKMITTGEGGMVITNNPWVAYKVRDLRNMAFGKESRYQHTDIGYNYRMGNINAAMGCAQLNRINRVTEIKRSMFNLYSKFIDRGVFQKEQLDGRSCRWMTGLVSDNKDSIRKNLSDNNIQSGDVFVPMNKQTFYPFKEECPVAEEISKKGLLLPSSIWLGEGELKHISMKVIESL